MYKFDEICELIKLVGSAGVASVEVEHAGSRVRIDGAQKVETVAAPASVVVPPAVVSEEPPSRVETSPVPEAVAETQDIQINRRYVEDIGTSHFVLSENGR